MDDMRRAELALATLDEIEARVLIMRHAGGASHEDIARTLGISTEVSEHIGHVGLRKTLDAFKALPSQPGEKGAQNAS